MNNFELFKWKKAGLSNLNINKVLAYQEKQGKKLTLRNVAVVSECKNPILFMSPSTSTITGTLNFFSSPTKASVKSLIEV